MINIFRLFRSFIISIVILLHLSACTPKPIPIAYHCPKIKLPPNPINYTASLNPESKSDDIAKAIIATTLGYKGWHDTVKKQVMDS